MLGKQELELMEGGKGKLLQNRRKKTDNDPKENDPIIAAQPTGETVAPEAEAFLEPVTAESSTDAEAQPAPDTAVMETEVAPTAELELPSEAEIVVTEEVVAVAADDPESISSNKEEEITIVPEGSTESDEAPQDQRPVLEDEDGNDESAESVELNLNRTTQIERSNKTYLISTIVRDLKKMNFDIPIQRKKGIWTDEQRGMLIHSALYGFPIPAVLVRKDEKGVLSYLDGLQRCTTFVDFVKGDWKMPKKGIPPIFGYDLSGKSFKDLPEKFQEDIKGTEFHIVVCEKMTDVEVEEMFIRWNSGTSLTPFMLTRVHASSKVMSIVNRIADEPFFKEYLSISDKQRKNFVDQEVIFHTIALMMADHEALATKGLSLGTKDVDKFTKEVLRDNGIPLEIQEKLLDTTRYMNQSFELMEEKYRTQALRRSHAPMLFLTALRLQEQGRNIKPMKFFEWAKNFLITSYDKQSAYKAGAGAGVAKAENVQKRYSNMLKNAEQHFNISEKAVDLA